MAPPECIYPDWKCMYGDLYECSREGKWVLVERNSPQCLVPPPPECISGWKCIGYDLYECMAGKWVLVERNSPQCEVPPPPPETFHLSIFVPSWAYGGYVEPGSGDYPANTTITLRAYPLSGYQFLSWGRDASGTSPTYNLYMNSDKNVEAYFEKVPVPEYKGTISRKELDYDGARSIIPVY